MLGSQDPTAKTGMPDGPIKADSTTPNALTHRSGKRRSRAFKKSSIASTSKSIRPLTQRLDHPLNLLTKMKLKQQTDSGSDDSPCSDSSGGELREINRQIFWLKIRCATMALTAIGMIALIWWMVASPPPMTGVQFWLGILTGFVGSRVDTWLAENCRPNERGLATAPQRPDLD